MLNSLDFEPANKSISETDHCKFTAMQQINILTLQNDIYKDRKKKSCDLSYLSLRGQPKVSRLIA